MTREEVVALLQRQDINYGAWNKPLSSLLREMEEDGTELVVENGKVKRKARSVWVVVTHLTLDGAIFKLEEYCRVFPNGGPVDYRSRAPDDHRGLILERGISETRRKYETGPEACMRLLREEAEFKNSCVDRLFPKRGFQSVRLESKPVPFVREKPSVAFKGLVSEVEIEAFDYAADNLEFNNADDGTTFVSIDEHGVKTYLVWREQHD